MDWFSIYNSIGNVYILFFLTSKQSSKQSLVSSGIILLSCLIGALKSAKLITTFQIVFSKLV